jgi:hypothetical protein
MAPPASAQSMGQRQHGNLDAAARTGRRVAPGWRTPTGIGHRRFRRSKMGFRITGLPAEPFAELFDLPDDALAARGAVRRIADDRRPGYPAGSA